MRVAPKVVALVACGLMAGSMTANAVPMNIVMHEDGFGGSGASWAGTFDTGEFNPDGSYWTVTNFNVVINGVAYNQIYDVFGLLLFLDLDPTAPPMLLGVVTPGPLTETTVQAIQFDAFFLNDVANRLWAFTPCSTVSCGGGIAINHYTLSEVTATVTEPGTLALLAVGLAGLAVFRRRLS